LLLLSLCEKVGFFFIFLIFLKRLADVKKGKMISSILFVPKETILPGNISAEEKETEKAVVKQMEEKQEKATELTIKNIDEINEVFIVDRISNYKISTHTTRDDKYNDNYEGPREFWKHGGYINISMCRTCPLFDKTVPKSSRYSSDHISRYESRILELGSMTLISECDKCAIEIHTSYSLNTNPEKIIRRKPITVQFSSTDDDDDDEIFTNRKENRGKKITWNNLFEIINRENISSKMQIDSVETIFDNHKLLIKVEMSE
jgi:hypothetical protein